MRPTIAALALLGLSGTTACGASSDDAGSDASPADTDTGDAGSTPDTTTTDDVGEVDAGDADAAPGDTDTGGADVDAVDAGADADADAQPDADACEGDACDPGACLPVFESTWAMSEPAFSGLAQYFGPIRTAPGGPLEVVSVTDTLALARAVSWSGEWAAARNLSMDSTAFLRGAADRDGDGAAELLVGEWEGSGESYFLVSLDPARAGARTAVDAWVSESTFSGPYSDGAMLSMTGLAGGVLSVCRVVDGARASCADHALPAGDGWTLVPEPTDFDGDGRPELAAVASSPGDRTRRTLHVFTMDVGIDAPAFVVPIGARTRFGFTRGRIDVDGDGATDIVGLDPAPWMVTGAFTDDPRLVTFECPAPTPGCAVRSAFDTNLDGRAEIITYDARVRAETWRLNPDLETWSFGQILPPGFSFERVDLDEDGVDEVLALTNWGPKVFELSDAGIVVPEQPAEAWADFDTVLDDAAHLRHYVLVPDTTGAARLAMVPDPSASAAALTLHGIGEDGFARAPASNEVDDVTDCTVLQAEPLRALCRRDGVPTLLDGDDASPLHEALGWTQWPGGALFITGAFAGSDPLGLAVVVSAAAGAAAGIDGPDDADTWAALFDRDASGWRLSHVVGIGGWTPPADRAPLFVLDVDRDGRADLIDASGASEGRYTVLLLGDRARTDAAAVPFDVAGVDSAELAFAALGAAQVPAAFLRTTVLMPVPRVDDVLRFGVLDAAGVVNAWELVHEQRHWAGNEMGLVPADLDLDGVYESVLTNVGDDLARTTTLAVSVDADNQPVLRQVMGHHSAGLVGTHDVDGDGITDLVVAAGAYGVHVAWGRCADATEVP